MFQIPMFKTAAMIKAAKNEFVSDIWSFDIRICFEFRDSDFEFISNLFRFCFFAAKNAKAIHRALIAILILFVSVTNLPLVFAAEAEGYLSVTGPCHLEFPEDHRAHPGYRTEWWYYTGNLQSESGDRYGFQLTFFRSQISPPGAEKDWPEPPSAWRTQQVYAAHAAISDISGKRHMQAELVSREALAMAGTLDRSPETIVFLENWSARIGPDAHRLEVMTNKFSYELALKPAKPPVLHGQDGYSLKGSSPERASCYYSYTRLELEGRLTIGGKTAEVSGEAWMDHEFSTAFLEPGIKGWDWFSLQLSDRTEIMAFLLRTEDGGISPASSGTFVDEDGNTNHLSRDQFTVTVFDTWKSPHSKAVYPSRWRLRIDPYNIDLIISPNLADQEMRTSKSTAVTYWEGSISIEGTREEKPIKGQGFVELTGYAKRIDVPM
jgi:predicted secreted hydrolase